MQGRSWMAAFTLAFATVLAFAGWNRDASAQEPAVVNKVWLALRVTGLGREGCEVEIKPGHPACDFKPITKKLESSGQEDFKYIVVKSTSADHDCLFSITIREPGQPEKTVKRGFVLATPKADGKPVPPQIFECWVRSPSLAAKDDTAKKIR